jgi:hypothetical protein
VSPWLSSALGEVTHVTSMKTRCARLCSAAALSAGVASVAVAVASVVLFIALGSGRESYTRLNSYLGWHGYLTLAVLPFTIAALCLGRARAALLAFVLCLGSWGVTTVLVANTFHGDRPPPDYRSTPNAQPAAAPNAGIASQLAVGHHRPGVGEPGRWAESAHE